MISHLPKLPSPPLPSISEPGIANTKGIAALVLLVLALGTMGVLAARYLRGSWNP